MSSSTQQPPNVSSIKQRLQAKKAQALSDFGIIKERQELGGTLVEELGSQQKREEAVQTSRFVGRVVEARVVGTGFYAKELGNRDLSEALAEFSNWKKDRSENESEKNFNSSGATIYTGGLPVHNQAGAVRNV